MTELVRVPMPESSPLTNADEVPVDIPRIEGSASAGGEDVIAFLPDHRGECLTSLLSPMSDEDLCDRLKPRTSKTA